MRRPALSIVSAVALSAGLAGCALKSHTHVTPSDAQPAPSVAQAPPKIVDGRMHTSYAFPTGHADSSVLLLERDLPAEIVRGQEFTYEMKVTNINHIPVEAVAIRDDCATGLIVTSAEPAPTTLKAPFVWTLGTLAPGESRTVRVTGRTDSTEPFSSCASVGYNSDLCLTAPVVSPALALTMTAPPEVTPCDTIPVRFTVSNSGTGAARNVNLAFPLPEGWTTADGKTSALFTIDTLPAKESREFVVNAKTARTGDFVSKATVTAVPALKVEATPVPTAVRQAVLAVNVKGPETVYAGRPVTFTFAVTNSGTGAATAATLESPLVPGVKFISATAGGVLRSNSVFWDLKTIPVKTTQTFAVTLEPTELGSLDGSATAKAYCANPARDAMSVQVVGIPALLLELVDLTDPVQVGQEAIYEIVITNQGSAPATNIKLAAMLEDTEEFVAATGAKARLTGKTLAFDPIATIAPKAKAVLRVTVKAVAPGDTRFKVTLMSDQVSRPVEESESTHLYR